MQHEVGCICSGLLPLHLCAKLRIGVIFFGEREEIINAK
jgi:hypothetical protein